MTRDRLAEYRYKSGIDENEIDSTADRSNGDLPGEQNGSSSRNIAKGISMLEKDLGLAYCEVAIIKKLIDDLKFDVEKVTDLQTKILLTPLLEEEIKGELDGLTLKIKTKSKFIRSKLKEMKKSNVEAEEKNEATSVSRIKSTQHSALLRNFFDVMNKYQLTQMEHKERCKAQIKRQLKLVGSQTTEDDIEEMIEQGKLSGFTEGISLFMETEQAKKKLADVETRHKDIINLESSLKDLHELFLEMALLVESQGAVLDSIESQVNNAKNYIQTGRRKLAKARDLRGRKAFL